MKLFMLSIFIMLAPFIARAQEAVVAIAEAVPEPDPTKILGIVEFILNIPIIGPYIPIITAVVTVGSFAATFITKPKPGSPWAMVYAVLVKLPGLLVGKAKV